MDKYVQAYVLLGFAAIPVTWLWSRLLHKLVQKYRREEEEPAIRIEWIPALVGICERAIITTLVGWKVSGAGGFIGAWMAMKAAGGWEIWSKGSPYGRAVFFIGLLGSLMSLGFGIFGGLIIRGEIPIAWLGGVS